MSVATLVLPVSRPSLGPTDDVCLSTSLFQHLPVHLQSTILAWGGAAFNTCQASATVPSDTRCLALWLQATKQQPLAAAAQHKLWQVAGHLLSEQGYQPGPCELHTTLAYIAEQGQVDLARTLLQAPLPINAQQLDSSSAQPQGVTAQAHPLAAAAKNGHAAMCSLLLEHGLGREQQVLDAALYAAAEQGHLEAVEVLLRAGADGGVYGHIRNSPLAAAARHGHFQVVKALASAAQPLVSRRVICGTLAAKEGHTAVVNLLTSDIDVNIHRGMLLSSAAWSGQTATAQYLIQRGADVNRDEGKALYLAAAGGHEATVLALLQHGANPNLGGHNRPLPEAVRGRHVSICAMLISSGASVEYRHHAQLLAMSREPQGAELAAALAESGKSVGTQTGN